MIAPLYVKAFAARSFQDPQLAVTQATEWANDWMEHNYQKIELVSHEVEYHTVSVERSTTYVCQVTIKYHNVAQLANPAFTGKTELLHEQATE